MTNVWPPRIRVLLILVLALGCSDDDSSMGDVGSDDVGSSDTSSADARDAAVDAPLPPTGMCASFRLAMSEASAAMALTVSDEGEVYLLGTASAGARLGTREASLDGPFAASIDRSGIVRWVSNVAGGSAPSDIHYDGGALHASDEEKVYALDAATGQWTEVGATAGRGAVFTKSDTELFAVNDSTVYEVRDGSLVEHQTVNSIAIEHIMHMNGMMIATGIARAGTPASGAILAFDYVSAESPSAYYEDPYVDPSYAAVAYVGLLRVAERVYLLRRPSSPVGSPDPFELHSFDVGDLQYDVSMQTFSGLTSESAGQLPNEVAATAMALDDRDMPVIIANSEDEAFVGSPATGFTVVNPPDGATGLQLNDIVYSSRCDRFVAAGVAQSDSAVETAVVVTIER